MCELLTGVYEKKNAIIEKWYLNKNVDAVIRQLGRLTRTDLGEDIKQELFYNLCKMPAQKIVIMEAEGRLKPYVFRSVYYFFNTNKSSFFNKNKVSRSLIKPYDSTMDDWKYDCVTHNISSVDTDHSEDLVNECLQEINKLDKFERDIIFLYALLGSAKKVGDKFNLSTDPIIKRLRCIRERIQDGLLLNGVIEKKVKFTNGGYLVPKYVRNRGKATINKEIHSIAILKSISHKMYDAEWPTASKMLYALFKSNAPISIVAISDFILNECEPYSKIDAAWFKRRISTDVIHHIKLGNITKVKNNSSSFYQYSLSDKAIKVIKDLPYKMSV